MIYLSCPKCGSINMKPGRYHGCYLCEDCGSESQLHEVVWGYTSAIFDESALNGSKYSVPKLQNWQGV